MANPICCHYRDETGAVLDCSCDNAEREILCHTCRLESPYQGWDECLRCGIASSLAEDPDYIHWAEKTYADQPEWLAPVRREWDRQAIALANAPYIRLTVRQAS